MGVGCVNSRIDHWLEARTVVMLHSTVAIIIQLPDTDHMVSESRRTVAPLSFCLWAHMHDFNSPTRGSLGPYPFGLPQAKMQITNANANTKLIQIQEITQTYQRAP